MLRWASSQKLGLQMARLLIEISRIWRMELESASSIKTDHRERPGCLTAVWPLLSRLRSAQCEKLRWKIQLDMKSS